MSTPSIALSSAQRRRPIPLILSGILAFVVAMSGAAAVLVGLLNLSKSGGYGVVALAGLVVFLGATAWGVQTVKAATGISIGRQFLVINATLVFAFFYLPILVLIVFSFNAGQILSVWDGFTFLRYAELLNRAEVLQAFRNTLIVTFTSTLISTIIGTMVSLAMERYDFRLKLPFDAVLYMPIIIPDIIMALATLLFFVIVFNMVKNLLGITWGLGLPTIIITHVAFNISFVATVVRARLVDMDPHLEQAARDLYANEWQAFYRVTMPLLMPGIISGALMAFTLSLDDFVITFFVTGPGADTLPLLIYSQVKFGVKPYINALATLMLVFSIGLVLLAQFLQRRR